MSNRSSSFRFALAILTGLFLVSLAFGSGYAIAAFQPRKGQPSQSEFHLNTPVNLPGPLGVFHEAWNLIESDFFGLLPSNRSRVYGAARGLLGTLDDPYTILVEPIPHRFEQDDLRGMYGGVGVSLTRSPDGQIVLSPFRDSPAAKAGIIEGDILLAIDSVSIMPDMDLSQDIAARIRGEVDTNVTLTIQRGEEVFGISITRQVIEVPSVFWYVLEEAPALGYIRIKSFTDRTADELKESLDELLAQDIQGLILDLRDNGGGLLQSAIDVADQFLNGGVVLYERRKGQEEKVYHAKNDGHALDVPLVVLVNHGTASASEIVAGAIQDRERGILIGASTFGKGSVQLIFGLSDGSSLHVTAARWYTPSRHQLDSGGLIPNLVVEAPLDRESDAQLTRAISFLLQQDN